MYRSVFIPLAIIVIATPAALADAPGPGPAEGAPMPLVLRGAGASGGVMTQSEAVDDLAVPVLKGAPAAAKRRAPRRAGGTGETGAAASGWRLIAGEKLWLIDVERELVIACRERDTLSVGRRAIECTADELPGLDP